jgi:hypothetical protein
MTVQDFPYRFHPWLSLLLSSPMSLSVSPVGPGTTPLDAAKGLQPHLMHLHFLFSDGLETVYTVLIIGLSSQINILLTDAKKKYISKSMAFIT